jgi:tetratricopeptide (TPR) repeat protein
MAERADDFYHQVNRSDNESAIELYERALGVDPDFAPAHSGLANALVQRVLRYPAEEVAPLDEVNLGNALASGRLATAEARRHLERALGLAERSVRLAPRNAPSHKALGFVYSALGRPDEAMAAYERALELDPNAWDVWINKGELHEIAGDDEAALLAFEQAFEAMGRVYEEQSSRVRPWHGELGTLIGGRHEGAGRAEAAEVWYRRVLSTAPLHPSATCALARLLRRAGDEAAAERLVRERRERTAEVLDCAEILRDLPAD